MDAFECIHWGDDYYVEKILQSGEISCYEFGYGVKMNEVSCNTLPKDIQEIILKEKI